MGDRYTEGEIASPTTTPTDRLSTDMPIREVPIPREALPPGWGPAEIDDGTLVYRHNGPGVELVADQTEAEQAHPGLGIGRYWELEFRYAVGEQSACKPIANVSTRRAALEGMLECMHRIHERVDDPETPQEVCAVLEDVSLGNVVPGREE